ncbi:MAG: hypothetical protein IIC59_10515 [Proteobacteria bacterium]|nr:hypothetical protein [Pseudomonadota bacterium]MCH8175603.1 hypothetical protein [Pseudomonadota bacterium]
MSKNNIEASVNQNIIHIGLDVDDTRYHGSALQIQGQTTFFLSARQQSRRQR